MTDKSDNHLAKFSQIHHNCFLLGISNITKSPQAARFSENLLGSRQGANFET